MPVPMLKGLAKRYGVSSERAEAAWTACSNAIKPKEKPGGYGLVVKCVKAKLRKK